MPADKIPPAPRWDLDSIFPGGSDSKEYAAFREKVKTELARAEKDLENLPETISEENVSQWADFISLLQSLFEDIGLVVSFAGCLSSQNVGDTAAGSIEAEGDLQYSVWKKLLAGLEARSLKQDDSAWQLLNTDSRMKAIKFNLDEIRTIASSKMPLELESLALDLSVNGLAAWDRLYTKMAGEIMVDFTENGETRKVSMGQLATKMSSVDRDVRRRAFEGMIEGWTTRADLAAMTLNSLIGFRQSLHGHRNWDSPLHEPLVLNRLKRETLDAMWAVISRETPKLKPYIDAKKKILGIDKFCWYDQAAPCGAADKLFPFDEAGNFIVEQAAGFSEHMAEFYRMALDKRWIEAEDRPGKRGGGYCTGMGKFKQSRIFMTYAGNFENLLTLAHELGHAYHSYVLNDKPPFAAEYPMNLAETASIFSETLIIDAALAASDDHQEKLMLIEQKLQAALGFFCDLHSRYLFERSFNEEREKGVVDRDRLTELMLAAQKKAFAGLLDDSGYHPLFWCSKLHFYISDFGFYNFPYTFGYLFAGGVYDRAKKEGPAFADKYRDLLADTGCMTTEELALKHLGVDLTGEDFWADAVNRSLADVDEFVKLTQ